MARAQFNAELIATLQAKANEHNAMAKALGLPLVRLQDLKDAYSKGYRRSNPEQRAMAKVDQVLARLGGIEDLAKVKPFDEQKHKRDKDGEFASPLGLPERLADHEQLQEDNAGYRALTSDVVPETRNRARAAIAAPALSIALSAGTLASLYRNKPNSLARAAARNIAGGVARATVQVPLSVAGHALATASERLAGGGTPRIKRVAVQEFTDRVGDRASDASRRVADKITAKAASALNMAVDGLVTRDPTRKAAAAGAKVLANGGTQRQADAAAEGVRLREEYYRMARKGIVLGTMGVAPGLLLNDEVIGPTADKIGGGLDAFQYRTVAKAVLEDAAAHDTLAQMKDILAKGGDAQDLVDGLTKNLGTGAKLLSQFRPFNRTQRIAGAAGAAALGATVGAAVGHIGHRLLASDGNPYHDKKGHFTSKDKAVERGHATGTAALLGGTAATLATLVAFRRINSNRLRAAAEAQLARTTRALKNLAVDATVSNNDTSPFYRHPVLDEMNEKRPEFVEKHMADSEAYKDALADLERSKGNSVKDFEGRVKGEIDSYLSYVLEEEAKAALKDVKGASKEVRKKVLQGIGRYAAKGAAEKAVSGSAAAAAVALKRIPDEARRKVALEVLESRDAKIAAVRDILSASERKLSKQREVADAAFLKVSEAEKAAKEAKLELDSSYERLDLAGGREEAPKSMVNAHAAAKKKWDALEAKAQAARKLAEKETSLYNDIQERRGIVPHPLQPGKFISPASSDDILVARTDLKAEAEKRAHAALNTKIQKKRKDLEDALKLRHARTMAAHAAAAREAGVLQDLGVTHWTVGARLVALQRRIETLSKLIGPEGDLTLKVHEAKSRAKAAEKSLGVGKKDTETDAAFEARKAKAVMDRDAAEFTLQDLEKRKGIAESELARRETQVLEAAHTYEGLMEAHAKLPKSKGLLSRVISDAQIRDIKRLGSDINGALRDFYNQPWDTEGKQTLRRYAESVGDYTRTAFGGAAKAFQDTYRELFMRQVPDADNPGKTIWLPSAQKIIGMSGLATGVIGALDAYGRWGKDKVLPPDDRKPHELPQELRRSSVVQVQRDPYTGAGYTALVLPDPDKPGQRLVLWGEKYRDNKSPGTPLVAGGSFGEMQRKFREEQQKNRPGGGDLASLPGAKVLEGKENSKLKDELKKAADSVRGDSFPSGEVGVVMRFRRSDDVKNVGAGGKVKGKIEKALKDKKTFDALQSIFSHEGQLLTQNEAFSLLTGYRADGGGAGNAALTDNGHKIEGFGSKDREEVIAALASYIDGQKERFEQKPYLRGQAHRIVALIGRVKGLPSKSIEDLHAAVRGDDPVDEPAEAPREDRQERSAHPGYSGSYHENVGGWSLDALDKHADREANKPGGISDLMGIDARSREHVPLAIAALAHHVHYAAQAQGVHLSEYEATQAASDFLHELLGLSSDAAEHEKDAARESFHRFDERNLSPEEMSMLTDATQRAIDAKTTGERYGKSDTPQRLRKFDASEVRDPSGQWSGGKGTFIGHAAGDAIDNVAGGQTRKGDGKGQGQAWYHPVRMAGDIGSIGLGEAAWQIAQAKLPQIAKPIAAAPAETFIGRAIQAISPTKAGLAYAGKSALRFGGTGLAGVAGGIIGNAALTAGVNEGYKLAGRKAPAYNPMQPKDAGEGLAEAGGQLAGAWGAPIAVGLLTGNPELGLAAKVLAGSAGTYLGGLLARGGYDLARDHVIGKHFQGYPTHTRKKLSRHFVAAAQL